MECFIHTWIPILSLIVAVATLCVVIVYTRITANIEKAAQEQAEASQKPVLVLWMTEREGASAQVLERIETRRVPHSMRLAKEDEQFILKNIGTGPALNVLYTFELAESKESGEIDRQARKLSYLPPSKCIHCEPGSTNSTQFKFTAEYESLSKRKYRTVISVERRDGLFVPNNDWIFESIPRKWNWKLSWY